jgi:DNA-directed RNA polymerase beta' subunit
VSNDSLINLNLLKIQSDPLGNIRESSGDEMNGFLPQSIETAMEVQYIADLGLNIITPKTSTPIIAQKQDQLLGAYNMTSDRFKYDWRTVMNLLSATTNALTSKIDKNREYSGREMFSYILPEKVNITLKADGNNPGIVIKNGEIISGRLANGSLGEGKDEGIVQIIWDQYGPQKTKTFLNNSTKLINNFNFHHGMSVGIEDLILTPENFNKLQLIFEEKKLEVEHEITKTENDPDLSQDTLLEAILKSKLEVLRDLSSKLLRKEMSPLNNFFTMIDSGSKGKDIQLAQMSGCVGQQDYHGGRIPKNLNGRTLPYFVQNDDRATARGFIQNSFLSGLELEEFIFNHMTAREGLIDQAVRSVTGDTKIVIIENSKPKVIEIGTLIDEYLKVANEKDIEREDKNNFELLKVKDIQIPTVDESGNVTWGDVTAVTRHDPGQQLFEIVTEGGRKVIVPESKSLLIWNDETEKFEPKLTPEVTLDDYVPVTMNLPAPLVINEFVDMTEYFPKKEYIYGSDFIKAKEEMKKAMENRDKIPCGWWKENNNKTFTLPYSDKASFQRVLSGRSDISNIEEGKFYSFSTCRDSSIPAKFELNKLNGQFIGLFIADGNVDIESGYIQITKSDENVLKFTEDYFDSMDIKYKRYRRVTDRGTIDYTRGYSRILGRFLDSFVGHGAHEKHVPEIALTAPKEFIIGLLDGYISGDGCVTDSSITAASCSETLIDGLNILLTRLKIFAKKYCRVYKNNEDREIKANYNSYEISIRSQWAKQFKKKIKTLINDDKNNKLKIINPTKNHPNYEEQEDVVLDKIKEINQIDVSKYKKLYDLTIPSTNNFIILNGMGCFDTADSGYVQRKLIKSTEDYMVGYDGLVRNAVGRICQYIYGDSGADSVRQYKYMFFMLNMGDKEITEEFKMTKEELKQTENFSEKDNENYSKLMLNVRDHLRKTQIKTAIDLFVLNIKFMLPVNLKRIILNKRAENVKGERIKDPKYILDKIEELLLNKNTMVMCLTEDDQKDTKSLKNKDDAITKTAFKYALYDILAPKKCIFKYNFTKKQIDEIFAEIKQNFNKSIVQAGEMVGIMAAQSLGEPITQLMLNAIHSAGIKGKGGMNIGVDRFKEIFSLSKNIKKPYMTLYFDKEHKNKKDFAYKIASFIKLTKIKDIRSSIEIIYDDNPLAENGYTKQDNITNVFGKNANKLSNEYDLTWLLRIKFEKEKILSKEITLLDIKSQLLTAWLNFVKDKKSVEKDKKLILDKISQLAILSNTDNDDVPIIHIRFDMQNITLASLIDFMDNFIDDFKLKGMKGIKDISEGKPFEERFIQFDENNALTTGNEYVIYTNGINLNDIQDIVGIDTNKIYCNDIITIFENYGIDAARNAIIKEIMSVLKSNMSTTNFQHIEIYADMMTNMGTLTSIDRHGLSKLDTDPLARASFEKTVEQLIQAAVFNEVDHMKSVSSRIMAGLCIKGGTGLCDLLIDTEMLENSEYTIDIEQTYKKTFENITEDKTQEIYDDIYIPEM